MRFWLIRKLIPDYRTTKGQELSIRLMHWITPHIEHAGYRWAISKDTEVKS